MVVDESSLRQEDTHGLVEPNASPMADHHLLSLNSPDQKQSS